MSKEIKTHNDRIRHRAEELKHQVVKLWEDMQDPETFEEAGKLMIDFRDTAKVVGDLKKILESAFNQFKFRTIPDMLNEQGTRSMGIEGLGTFTMATDVKLSKDKPELWMDWLKDHGHGEAIKETIHSSTEKAVVKTLLNEGVELPDHILVEEVPYITFRKKA